LEKGIDMKTELKTLTAAAALIVGIISASAVYAHGQSESPGSMMGQGGIMGQGGTMQGSPGNMMGGGHMMGMMNMMGQMSTMMETCNKTMQGMMEKHEQSPEAHPQQQE
jgi:hypothetical protein